LSIVLFSLILTLGIGSWLSERIPFRGSKGFIAWAATTFAYLALIPFWSPTMLQQLQGGGIGIRAALAVGIIAPAGLLMGFGFPVGMRLVRAIDPTPTPWFWGINGAAGVLASVLAVALSIAFGISTALMLGATCYLLLIPAARAIRSSAAKSTGAPA
jgi:hypothetical protein